MDCILCGTPMVSLFCARDYRRLDDREARQLCWCTACKFGRLAGDFTPSEVASFYPDAYYTHGDDPNHDQDLSLLDRLRVHMAWRLDNGIPFDPGELARPRHGYLTSCDLGCGSGGQLRQFKEAGYKVIGVEPDPRAREVAAEAGEVFDGTAEDIPSQLSDLRFDVVLLSHVLEHCVDPLKALSNARNILASHGTLVIEVPNNSALGFSTFRAAWPWTDIPRHLNFFTEQSLRAALQMAGFKVTKVNYVGYTRQFGLAWIRTQEDIWAKIGTESKPNFKIAAWALLFRTAFASAPLKYDSVRVHAIRSF